MTMARAATGWGGVGFQPVSGSMPTTTGGDAGPTGTWSDETEHFNDTSVIDDWPAGYVGLYVGPQSSAAATVSAGGRNVPVMGR
jgi:hypothetical protein